MSDTGPIVAGSPLARVLDQDSAPTLSAGFMERVLARTEGRAEPLPMLRKSILTGPWTRTRRVAVGAVVAGALATTAAATGVLQQLPVALPSAEQVWATLSGQEPPEPAQIRQQTSETIVEQRRVRIEGPIDTPEELEEAFTRIDRVRETRTEIRRSNVDQRIEREINRRREQGLRAPNEQQEELLRGIIDQRRELNDSRLDQLSEQRREELRERVEAGEELTREDLIPPGMRQTPEGRVIRQRLRQLRDLPPDQRRAVIRRLRERQQERAGQQGAESGVIEAAPDAQVDQSSAE